jgi:methylmalonyl-CoA/ethylmalonyl-CoA epimerase
MKRQTMVVDHIGLVVRSLEQAITSWERAFGYSQMTKPVINSRQKVRVVFLEKEGSIPVKLVEPLDPTSPAFALSTRGGGLHHLCFKSADMNAALRHLQNEGARVLVPPQPGEAFEEEPIAFVHFHGVPIEIIATEKKAKKIRNTKRSEERHG